MLVFGAALADGVEEVDQLIRCHLGLDQEAVGLLFDVGANVVALLQIGGDNNLGVDLWNAGWISERSQNLDSGQVGDHQVKQDDVVVVGLGLLEGFFAVGYYCDFVAVLG